MKNFTGQFALYLPKIRQFFLLCVLFLCIIHPQKCPPFMVAGFLFAIAHIVMNWRSIPLRKYWPYLLPIGFYLFYLLYALIVGSVADAGRVYIRRVAYLMIPFLFVDMKPSRLWGSALIVSSILTVLLALAVATVKSFVQVDGEYVFSFIREPYWEDNLPSLWQAYCVGATYYNYAWLSCNIGLWPSFVGLGVLVSLTISVHRFIAGEAGRSRRLYLGAAIFLFFSLLLLNSRTNLLAAFLLFTIVLLYYFLSRRSTMRLRFSLLALLIVGVVALSFTRLNFFIYGIGDSLQNFLSGDARIGFWQRIAADHATYFPWGIGPSSTLSYMRNLQPDVPNFDMRIVKAHNELLETLVEAGVLGLLYQLVLLAMPFFFYRRFAPIQFLLFVPIYVMLNFESVSVMAEALLIFIVLYCFVWSFAIARSRGEAGYAMVSAPYL